MTPFRQLIRPQDVGSDVLAYKRALRSMGVANADQLAVRGKTARVAGPAFTALIRSIERAHRLTVDGIAGPKLHSLIAPHFDARGVYLYQHAAIRLHPAYLNPFAKTTSLVVGRIDMGVDYHGTGPICAIGDAEIVGLGGAGWPGGEYLLYRLTAGPQAGRYVYVAEAIIPTVRGGDLVKAGDVICSFGPGARTGFYPGIETGWGSPTVNETLAAQMGNTGGAAHSDSPAGLAFARWLRAIGAPAPYAGLGPVYP